MFVVGGKQEALEIIHCEDRHPGFLEVSFGGEFYSPSKLLLIFLPPSLQGLILISQCFFFFFLLF
jgi:hypothetical protein